MTDPRLPAHDPSSLSGSADLFEGADLSDSADPSSIDLSGSADLFGSTVVAMVTPMTPDGAVDGSGVAALVDHLVAGGCDGIVVAGTTGEAPTLSEPEVAGLIRVVAARARGRARVIAGAGTYDTAVSIRRARAAEEAGADGLLLVSPYYSRPTQAGVVAHCTAVADATGLPVMLYDVPARTGLALSASALTELAAHSRIRAVKDAKGDLFEAMSVMAGTSLAYYCGSDELNLPYLACGATGLVSVVGNVAPGAVSELVRAVGSGDLAAARGIQRALLPLTEALTAGAQGAVMAKAALAELGVIPHAGVRLPLLPPAPPELDRLRAALEPARTPD